jgi:hypothetical protein
MSPKKDTSIWKVFSGTISKNTMSYMTHIRDFSGKYHEPRRRRSMHGEGRRKFLCAQCERKHYVDGAPLHPRKCLNQNRFPHQLCQNCWWNGFADENANHECIGCLKGIPLVKPRRSVRLQRLQPVVDLTEDSDSD